MANQVLGKCPVCSSEIEITRINCRNCGTQIEGHFNLCKFCKLTNEQKNFIDVFIKCRGNIKEVEKELGVSYPTVRNRLEEVASVLGHGPFTETGTSNKRKEVLDRLNNGEISVEEAINQLKD